MLLLAQLLFLFKGIIQLDGRHKSYSLPVVLDSLSPNRCCEVKFSDARRFSG